MAIVPWAHNVIHPYRTAKGYGMWYWPKADSEVNGLLLRGLRALQTEDALLRAAFDQNPDSYANDAHGLAYWVFEHNLVFPIFREWVKTHVVAWDQPLREDIHPPISGIDERPHSEDELLSKKKPGRKLIDLQVQLTTPSDIGGPARALFEAKWWVSGLAHRILKRDAEALEAIGTEAPPPLCQGYQIAFWYGNKDSVDEDFDEKHFGKPVAHEPVFAGMFTSHVFARWKEPTPALDPFGYFAMLVWPVPGTIATADRSKPR